MNLSTYCILNVFVSHLNVGIMSPTALQIKVKALQRLIKEKSFYSKEVTECAHKLEQMKSAGADQYDVMKQTQIWEESQRMVPELERKIQDHTQSLSEFLKTYDGEEDTTTAVSLAK